MNLREIDPLFYKGYQCLFILPLIVVYSEKTTYYLLIVVLSFLLNGEGFRKILFTV